MPRHGIVSFTNMRFSLLILLGTLAALLPLSAAEKLAPVTIAALVSQTLAENPEIKFYEAEIHAAKAGLRQAAQWANPELSLEIGRKSVRSSDASTSGVAWAASLAQPIEWPGRLGLRKAIANSDVALAETGLVKFKQAVASKVRTLAFSLAMQQERAAAAAEVQDRLTALKDVVVQRDPAGVTPLLEAKVIEATAIVVQKEAGDAAIAMQKALLELNQLRGRRADSPLIVQRAEFSFPEYAGIPDLLSQAASGNYDLKVRIRELETQGLKVSLAKNERYPTFTVGPAISQERAGERETTAGIAFSVPLPLWNNGKAGIASAEARLMQARASLLATQREVERQVTEAALLYETHRQRLALMKPETLQSFKESAALADRHYRLGAVEISTYIELQEKYLEAVEAINETKATALEAAMNLEQFIGLTASRFARDSAPASPPVAKQKNTKSKK
jgi:cobalt-zinc-cadmium efflux system outer membrane protein